METFLTAPRRFWSLVAALLTVHALLAADCARQWTPTHDEYWHLPLGLYAWQTGDLSADPINPPLVRSWAALPLWLSGVTVELPADVAADSNTVGDAFFRLHTADHRERFGPGRLMMIPVSLLGGVLFAWWARHWYGSLAGLLAAELYAVCPTLIAHAAIVAHDLPLAVATLLVLVLLVRLQEQPTRQRAVQFGIAIGLAQLTKLTAVLLGPLAILLWWVLPRRERRLSTRCVILGVCIVTVMTLLVLHAGYGFRGTLAGIAQAVRGESAHPQPETLSTMQTLGWWSLNFTPTEYRAAWLRLAQDLRTTHPIYLNGEWQEGGYRTYYLWALWDKTPLGVWLLVACGLAVSMARREWRRLAFVLIALAAVVGPASLSNNQLGIRYVLPALPLLILLAAPSVLWLLSPTRGLWRIVVGLGLLGALLPLANHPHQLSYMHELAGGLRDGWRSLIDSNIDWSQDLHFLRDYLRAHPPRDRLKLAYFGTVSPSGLGIEYDFPPAHNPQPGVYAVSVSFRAGRPHRLRDLDGRIRIVGLDEFGYLRFFEPKAYIGGSIVLFDLSPEDVARFYAARAAINP